MKFIVKLLLPIFKKYLIKQIIDEENKNFVVTKLSKHIELPGLNDEQEQIIIGKIYDAMTEITKAYLGDK
jgi:hypothetical protein